MKYFVKPGDKFGYLELVEQINVDGRMFWKCQCVCGKIVLRRRDYVTGWMKNRVSSCGCKFSERIENGADSPKWKGCGEISGWYLSMIKCKCNRLDIEWNVSKEYIWDLFLKQDKKCKLTGKKLTFATPREKRAGLEQTASLDRIDSNKGYVEGNVQWLHKDVNLMKNHFNQAYFVEMCKKVVANYGVNSSQDARTSE